MGHGLSYPRGLGQPAQPKSQSALKEPLVKPTGCPKRPFRKTGQHALKKLPKMGNMKQMKQKATAFGNPHPNAAVPSAIVFDTLQLGDFGCRQKVNQLLKYFARMMG